MEVVGVVDRGGIARVPPTVNNRVRLTELLTKDDIGEDDLIIKLEPVGKKGVVGKVIKKRDIINMHDNELQIHRMNGLKWRDPYNRVREITYGVSDAKNPTEAATNAIFNAYKEFHGCSILDDMDPSFSAKKEDYIIFPIFTLSLLGADNLKFYTRRRKGATGSLKSANSAKVLANCLSSIDAVVDQYIDGIIETVPDDEPKFVVVADKPSPKKAIAKKYQCDFPGCESSFSTPRDLQRHTVIHTGEKPYFCTKCSQRFASPGALANHIKKGTCEDRRKGRKIKFVDLHLNRSMNAGAAVSPPPPQPTTLKPSTVTSSSSSQSFINYLNGPETDEEDDFLVNEASWIEKEAGWLAEKKEWLAKEKGFENEILSLKRQLLDSSDIRPPLSNIYNLPKKLKQSTLPFGNRM